MDKQLLKQLMLSAIQEVNAERKEQNKAPEWATETSIFSKLRQEAEAALDELEAEGAIAHHINVNHIRMFYITEKGSAK